MQKAGKWREVCAVSVTIKQETSAKDFTGRAEQRKSGENANAGRLKRKGKQDRTESRLRVGRLVGEDSHKLDKQSREDDDKRTRTSEKLTAQAIESTEADRVVHRIKNREQ